MLVQLTFYCFILQNQEDKNKERMKQTLQSRMGIWDL